MPKRPVIRKASGEPQAFSRRKLYHSLKKAGAPVRLAQNLSQQLSRELTDDFSTDDIHQQVVRKLRHKDRLIALRYSLKRALQELGPSGYPFERYVAAVLENYGYQTEVGRIIQGSCVRHEVDIIARKSDRHIMIECKFHNRPGVKSDLKVALYVYARFLDIEEVWQKRSGHWQKFHQAWLVTNTKCTGDAIRFAHCRGMKIISWGYPSSGNLQELIEKKKLYPLTILPALKNFQKKVLLSGGLVLVKDLLDDKRLNKAARAARLSSRGIKNLQKQARGLCGC